MAVSAFTLYNSHLANEANGLIDFSGDDFSVILLTDAYTPDVALDATVADVSAHEVAAGGGYATGGIDLGPMDVVSSGGVLTISPALDPEWTAATFDCKYAVIARRAGGSLDGSDMLVGHVDLDDSGGSVSVASGTLKVNWTTVGIIVKEIVLPE